MNKRKAAGLTQQQLADKLNLMRLGGLRKSAKTTYCDKSKSHKR